MKTIDKAVLAGYNAGIERNRLRTGIGLIEFERTKRDIASSNERVIQHTKNHRFVSRDGEVPISNFMRIDNSNIEPDVVAKMIKERFDL